MIMKLSWTSWFDKLWWWSQVRLPDAGKMHFMHSDQQIFSGGRPRHPAWTSQLRCSLGQALHDMVPSAPPQAKNPSYAPVADCFKLYVFTSISVVYAKMPYCIVKYCHVRYENNPSKYNAHFHRLPKRCALRMQWLAKCGRPARRDKQARNVWIGDGPTHYR